jgi:hypothetical protein
MPYTAKENIYVTSMGEDGKVVPGDDPAAGFLLVGAGGEIADELAERFGLTRGAKAASTDAAEAETPAPAPKAPASKAK